MKAPWCVCLLAAAGLSLAAAQQDVKSIPLDWSLELNPDNTSVTQDNITGILWKHGPSKVVEWDENYGPHVDYYGTYKERTELNKETGKLVIKNMTIEDSGVYSMEVNGRLQSKTYSVEVIKKVPKPLVAIQPLDCSPYYRRCTLICQGDIKDSGLVTYRWIWREDGGKWMVFDSGQKPTHWNISNNRQGRRVHEYFCEMKNLVSEEQSDPCHNPFLHKGSTAMAIIIIIGRVTAGLAISFLLMSATVSFVIRNRRSRRVAAHVQAATTEDAL